MSTETDLRSVNRVILDTCVVVDAYVSTRPRHLLAAELLAELKARSVDVLFPVFAFFELRHAIESERAHANGSIVAGVADEPVMEYRFVPVPIDEDFFERYFDVSLPPLRGGDLIFTALARGEDLPLVTEDAQLRAGAARAGVKALSIEDALHGLKFDSP